MDNWIILGTLAAYKLMLLGVGLWASNRNKSESDFFLGGRGLGPWVAGLSYAASTSSAWVLLGVSGFIYTTGLSALWMIPGILMGYVVVWVWLGPRIRAETEARGHVTMTDYMAAGTGGAMRKAIALWSALLVLFCFIFYIAAQFGAAAIAFESQFGLGHFESVAIGAAVILIYSLMGGFWAVSVTDTIQGALMALIAIALPVAALLAAGGPGEVIATLSANEPSAFLSWTGERPAFLFLGFAMGIASIGLGTFGQPHLIARLMAVKDEAARKRGFAIAMGWAVIVYAGMSTLALSGRALLGGGQEGEAMFYTLAAELFPPVFAGLVIAAVLSAVMSTVDSLLIATSAAVAHDMGVAKAMPGREVLISRVVMTALCVLAVVLAMTLPASIFSRVLFSWSALGAAFGPILFARVAGVEPKPMAILLAITAGFFITVLFYIYGQIGGDSLLARLAALPGDPFERIFPWLVPLVLVFTWRQSRRVGSSPDS